MAQSPPPKNGVNALLTMASTGDNWVKLATIGLVAFSGAGNWFATKQDGAQSREQIEQKIEQVRSQAASEIHEVYVKLKESGDAFRANNEDSARARELAEQNTKELAEILKTQQQILNEIHRPHEQ